MAGDTDAPTANSEAEVSSRRRGIGLCLSGGGFRATLFHAGVIQRLFELGIATRTDGRGTVRDAAAIGRPEAPSETRALGFETVASVSGGSITAAQWAVAVRIHRGSLWGRRWLLRLAFRRCLGRCVSSARLSGSRVGGRMGRGRLSGGGSFLGCEKAEGRVRGLGGATRLRPRPLR